MQRLGVELAILIALFVPITTAIVLALLPSFAQKSARREDYLKRVARKYIVSPLNLR